MKVTAGELKVMQLLWEYGEIKLCELQELYPGPIKVFCRESKKKLLLTLVKSEKLTEEQLLELKAIAAKGDE